MQRCSWEGECRQLVKKIDFVFSVLYSAQTDSVAYPASYPVGT
jgi:hypothetical protein